MRRTALIFAAIINFLISSTVTAQRPEVQESANSIVVRTKSLDVEISLRGGVPTRWSMIDPEFVGPRDKAARVEYIAQPSKHLKILSRHTLALWLPPDLVDANRLDNLEFKYSGELDDSGNQRVRLTALLSEPNLEIQKILDFPERGFNVKYTVILTNHGGQVLDFRRDNYGLAISLGPGLGVAPVPGSGIGSGLYSYVVPFMKTDEGIVTIDLEPGTAFTPSESETESLEFAGIHNRYFVSCLISDDQTAAAARFHAVGADLDKNSPSSADGGGVGYPAIMLHTRPFKIDAGESKSFTYTYFAGPKQVKILREENVGLDGLLYSRLWNWLRWLCFLLFSLLKGIYAVVSNWGVSIILMAVAVRLLILPFSHKATKSNNAMLAAQAELRPLIAEIEENHKGDYTMIHGETMKLYREHGINPYAPLKGCFWVLLQIPVFTALFNILGQAYELRGVSFLYIDDLSLPDRLFSFGFEIPFIGSHFNLLPVIMAATMVVTTGLGARPGADVRENRKQMRSMIFLAVVFFVLFYSFPAGLVIYWTTSNLVQFAHQKAVALLG